MPVFVMETLLDATRQQVWDFHMQPGALEKLTPPGSGVRIVRPAPVENGTEVELRIRAKPLPLELQWVSRHQDVDPPNRFVDVAVRSPFALWEHHHLFIDRGGKCLMRDEVRYGAPLGAVGNLVAGPFIRRMLREQFTYRHRVLADAFGVAPR